MHRSVAVCMALLASFVVFLYVRMYVHIVRQIDSSGSNWLRGKKVEQKSFFQLSRYIVGKVDENLKGFFKVGGWEQFL